MAAPLRSELASSSHTQEKVIRPAPLCLQHWCGYSRTARQRVAGHSSASRYLRNIGHKGSRGESCMGRAFKLFGKEFGNGTGTQVLPSPARRSPRSPKDVVLEFYRCYNSRDIPALLALFEDGELYYHDTVYLKPMRSKAALAAFFDKLGGILPPDLRFEVEDITDGDPRKVGVRWHVELEGNEFPFSRGASFYEVNERGKIVYVRDVVEPALKPGDAALQGLAAVSPLVRKAGPSASPEAIERLADNIPSALMWGFYAVYMGLLLLSTIPPGNPAYAIPSNTFTELFHMSVDFFYVTPLLNRVGITFVPDLPTNPVYEAIFNSVIAWAVMFWPLMLADPRGARVRNKLQLWLGNVFITNIFFVPYMALRLRPAPEDGNQAKGDAQLEEPALPSYSPAFGWLGLGIFGVSTVWALAARPEFGGLAERGAFFLERAATDRVFFAFLLDIVLYTIFQSVLMPRESGPLRNIPLVGMALWLIKGGASQGNKDE